jgi:type I restriction enzyme, S subunit
MGEIFEREGDRGELDMSEGLSEWQEYKFSDVLIDENISYGIVQPGFHTEIDSVPVVRVNNIKNGKIKIDDVLKVSSEIEKKYLRTRLEGGELLITVVGSVGECAIVPESLKGWNVARAVSVARIKEEFDKRFVKYCFKSEDLKFQMYGNTNDTVQPTLNLSSLKELVLNIPPLPEQKAIASILSSLDNKIDLLHRQNRTLEAIAETLFRQWFVEDAQDDWEKSNLGSEFDFIMGQSPSGSSFNEEGIGVPMFQGNADFGFRFPTERIYTTEPTRVAQKFDTLISVRAPVGAQNMAHKECCIGRGVAAFRYKKDRNFYTYTYFKLRSLVEEIKKFNDEGTVFGSISRSNFDGLTINIPPNKLLFKFENEVKSVNDKVIENCQQIHTLEKLRNNLLPKLMSGEIRVSY